ncbi:hypothetical protein LguiA_035211 [Lonicera macranthoides]
MSSMSISSLTSFKLTPLKFSSQTPPFPLLTRIPILSSLSSPITPKPLNLQHRRSTFSGLDSKKLGFSLFRNLGFAIKAKNEEQVKRENSVVDEEFDAGQSTMPDRFKHFLKEVPEPPIRWPYYVALAFLIFTWRTVLWELSNWKNTVLHLSNFFAYLLKYALAIMYMFIGDPITSVIRAIETSVYTVRAFYSAIVAYTPVPELTVIIIVSSAALAIAEATEPDSVNRQPYLLTIAGLFGFAAVKGFISEPFFYTILLGLFGFARLVKKRDYVSSFLPGAAVLAAIGEPWFRVVVMAAYLGLAIVHHSKKVSEGKEGEGSETDKRVPTPLLCVALAVGVRLAANWLGYRHLTWMIV